MVKRGGTRPGWRAFHALLLPLFWIVGAGCDSGCGGSRSSPRPPEPPGPTATVTQQLAPAEVFKVGTFLRTTAAAPAQQVVTHNLGATPRALILWTEGQAGFDSEHGLGAIGFFDGSTALTVGGASHDNVAKTATGRRLAAKVISLAEGRGISPTINSEADITAWDSSTFTLNWTTNDVSWAPEIHYLVIGGTGVTAKVLSWTGPGAGATGLHAVTGVGFRPAVVLHAFTAPSDTIPTKALNLHRHLGVMDAAGNQWVHGRYSVDDLPTTSDTYRYQATDATIAFSAGTAAYTERAVFSSMDATGFTVDFTATPSSSTGTTFISLALAGLSAKAGHFDKSTAAAPTQQPISGLAFRPEALLMASHQSPATVGGNIAHGRHAIGATDGTSYAFIAATDQDAVADCNTWTYSTTAALFEKIDNDVATVDARATLASFDSGGFTLNWATNDAAATQLTYIAFGAASTSSASRLGLSGVTSPRSVGESSDVTVQVQDANGNRVTSYVGTIRFSASDALAELPGNYTFTAADNGIHTFTGGVRFNSPGIVTLTAIDIAAPGVTGQLADIDVRQVQGATCTAASQCGTGFCVDGVCCNAACTGACVACDNVGSVGTCTSVADGASCEDASYCNGNETCRSGACTPGVSVTCVDPDGVDALVCSDATRSCEKLADSPPSIIEDAVLTGGVAVPYVYNALGAIRVLGERPMFFSSCGGPSGFHVDAQSGAVVWTPSSVGSVSLCVRAENGFGVDTYPFTVTVMTPAGAPPIASFTATPPIGVAPLSVRFDASGSVADPSTSLVAYAWDDGMGGPPGTGLTSASTYAVPGSYPVTLTVTDGHGRQASATQMQTVLTPEGARPPSARITASALTGDASLTAEFGCECAAGDAPIVSHVWSFGGDTTTGERVMRSFGPGRYRVRLTVVDAAGLTGTDVAEVVVTDGARIPPTCRAWASPAVSTAPASTVLRAVFSEPQGAIASVTWTLWDQTTSSEPELWRALPDPGSYPARLRVQDDEGLLCLDEVEIIVLTPEGHVPPRILHVAPLHAFCGRPADGPAPVVAGTAPFTFSVHDAPDGLRAEDATGTIEWVPSSTDSGTHTFALRVSGRGGADSSPAQVDVSCEEARPLDVGCGCGATRGKTALGWLCVLALALSRKPKRR